ncbi:hypothetical protein PENTCL1PPCAC_14540, partial [Pristionchus entomophagus]
TIFALLLLCFVVYAQNMGGGFNVRGKRDAAGIAANLRGKRAAAGMNANMGAGGLSAGSNMKGKREAGFEADAKAAVIPRAAGAEVKAGAKPTRAAGKRCTHLPI